MIRNEFQRGVESALAGLQSDSAMHRNALFHILVRTYRVMAKLDALEAEVGEVRGTVDSAVALIRGLRQQIIDAGTDPQKLAELVAELDKSQKDLADAVAENPGPSTGGI